MTALSPLHMVVVWLAAILANVLTLAQVFGQPLHFIDNFIIANCSIAAAVIPLSLTFKSFYPAVKEESVAHRPVTVPSAPAPKKLAEASAQTVEESAFFSLDSRSYAVEESHVQSESLDEHRRVEVDEKSQDIEITQVVLE